MTRSLLAVGLAIGALAGLGAETTLAGDVAAARAVAETVEGAAASSQWDPVARHDLLSPAVLPLLIDVFVSGGAGYRRTESAAFLVVDDAGGYRTVQWPRSNEWQAARFGGAAPQGATAIVHTHPARSPRPSEGDAATARQTGLAVVVLTARDIFVATPDGATIALVRGRFWADPRARDSRQAPRELKTPR